jgi:O-antigen ligase
MAGLILAKCAVGVVAYVMGQALAFGGESGQLIYYEAPMNFLMVLYLVAVVIALIAKVPVPRWILLGWPLVLITLGLSFRRSFWIAGLLSLALAALVASGRRGRPWVLMAGAALVLALWSVLAAGQSTDTDNPIVERAQTLNPSQVRQSTGDRYRLDEQRNVVEEIQRNPITGIGLGVPWKARSPLSEEHTGGRYYTHVTLLWYWLNTGPIGFIAYIWLTAVTIWTGLQLWRRGLEKWERVVALAFAVGSVGLAVAETTGSFSGINFRFTVVLGACIAWLASALADAPDHEHRGGALLAEVGERPAAAV